MAKPKTTDDSNTDVATTPSAFTREELSGITTMRDAMTMVDAVHGGVIAAHQTTELGDGFKIVDEDDKAKLVGVPLLFLEWTFVPGDFDDEYVSIRAVSEDDQTGAVRKYIINDGGTGICRDLRDFTTKTGRNGGLFVKNGLRVSNYHIDPKTNEPMSKANARAAIARGDKIVPASTYYLDASA